MDSSPRPVRRFSRWQTTKRTFVLGDVKSCDTEKGQSAIKGNHDTSAESSTKAKDVLNSSSDRRKKRQKSSAVKPAHTKKHLDDSREKYTEGDMYAEANKLPVDDPLRSDGANSKSALSNISQNLSPHEEEEQTDVHNSVNNVSDTESAGDIASRNLRQPSQKIMDDESSDSVSTDKENKDQDLAAGDSTSANRKFRGGTRQSKPRPTEGNESQSGDIVSESEATESEVIVNNLSNSRVSLRNRSALARAETVSKHQHYPSTRKQKKRVETSAASVLEEQSYVESSGASQSIQKKKTKGRQAKSRSSSSKDTSGDDQNIDGKNGRRSSTSRAESLSESQKDVTSASKSRKMSKTLPQADPASSSLNASDSHNTTAGSRRGGLRDRSLLPTPESMQQSRQYPVSFYYSTRKASVSNRSIDESITGRKGKANLSRNESAIGKNLKTNHSRNESAVGKKQRTALSKYSAESTFYSTGKNDKSVDSRSNKSQMSSGRTKESSKKSSSSHHSAYTSSSSHQSVSNTKTYPVSKLTNSGIGKSLKSPTKGADGARVSYNHENYMPSSPYSANHSSQHTKDKKGSKSTLNNSSKTESVPHRKQGKRKSSDSSQDSENDFQSSKKIRKSSQRETKSVHETAADVRHSTKSSRVSYKETSNKQYSLPKLVQDKAANARDSKNQNGGSQKEAPNKHHSLSKSGRETVKNVGNSRKPSRVSENKAASSSKQYSLPRRSALKHNCQKLSPVQSTSKSMALDCGTSFEQVSATVVNPTWKQPSKVAIRKPSSQADTVNDTMLGQNKVIRKRKLIEELEKCDEISNSQKVNRKGSHDVYLWCEDGESRPGSDVTAYDVILQSVIDLEDKLSEEAEDDEVSHKLVKKVMGRMKRRITPMISKAKEVKDLERDIRKRKSRCNKLSSDIEEKKKQISSVRSEIASLSGESEDKNLTSASEWMKGYAQLMEVFTSK